jgi:hypothetical protein
MDARLGTVERQEVEWPLADANDTDVDVDEDHHRVLVMTNRLLAVTLVAFLVVVGWLVLT